MKSIKTKIIVSIIACTLLSAIPVGFMSLRNVYQTSNQGAEQELALKCRNEQEQINAQISKIEQSVDTLSSIAMNKLDFSKFKSSAVYVKQYTDSIMSDVVKFGEHTDGAICVYVRYNPDFTEPTSGISLPETARTRNSPVLYQRTLPCMTKRMWSMSAGIMFL